MPEGTPDASILIAISFQALNRVIKDNKETEISDSTVVILFAAFFIESNHNYIVNFLKKEDEMLNFLYGKNRKVKKYPGLQLKLKWFHNEFIKTLSSEDKKKITKKLDLEFPSFEKIYKFRNKISHGEVDLSLANRKDAEDLRQKAKNIVDKLYEIVKDKTGIKIPRDTSYKTATNQV
jgi:hypothetical protein